MSAQGLIVAVIVIACCGYAVWTMMPGVARRALAAALMRLPLSAALMQRLARAAAPANSCGCNGCDRSELAPKPQVVSFHPRLRR